MPNGQMADLVQKHHLTQCFRERCRARENGPGASVPNDFAETRSRENDESFDAKTLSDCTRVGGVNDWAAMHSMLEPKIPKLGVILTWWAQVFPHHRYAPVWRKVAVIAAMAAL
jgi:hypothetical protein